MSKIKSILAFVALMLCGGAWAEDQVLVSDHLTTSAWVDTNWTVDSLDELMTYSYYGTMAGSSIGGGSAPARGFIIRKEGATVTVQMQVRQKATGEDYLKVAKFALTLNDQKHVLVKGVAAGYLSGVNVGTEITNWNSTFGSGAYGINKLVATKLPSAFSKPGVRMWLDASDSSTITSDSEGVKKWADKFSNTQDATPSTAYVNVDDVLTGVTRYASVATVNGNTSIQMGTVPSGIDLAFTQMTDIRTVFWVMDIQQNGNAFFLADSGSYHFHRNVNQYVNGDASANVRNGTWKCDGLKVNPTGDTTPAGHHIYSLVTTGNVTANSLSQDRQVSDQRNGGRAISELIVFNRALSAEEVAEVEAYLANKWTIVQSTEETVTNLAEGGSTTWGDIGTKANVTLNVTGNARLGVGGSKSISGRFLINVAPGAKLTIYDNGNVGYINAATSVYITGGGTVETPTFQTLGTPARVYVEKGSTWTINNGSSTVDARSWNLSRIQGEGTIELIGSNWVAFPTSAANMFATTLSVKANNTTGVVCANESTTEMGTLSGSYNLRTDLGTATTRIIRVLQSEDSTWSGKFTNDRLGTLKIAGYPGATSKTLTLTATFTENDNLEVEASGSVKLNGTWKGTTETISGEFGGSGSITDATTITVNNGAKIRADWGAVTANVAPTFASGAVIGVVAESIPAGNKIKLFSGSGFTASENVAKARILSTAGEVLSFGTVAVEADGVYAIASAEAKNPTLYYGYAMTGSVNNMIVKEEDASNQLTKGGNFASGDFSDGKLNLGTNAGSHYGTNGAYPQGDFTFITLVKTPSSINKTIFAFGGQKNTSGLVGLRYAGNDRVCLFTGGSLDLTEVRALDSANTFHVYTIKYSKSTGMIQMSVDKGPYTEPVAFTSGASGEWQFGGIHGGQIDGFAENANGGQMGEFRVYASELTDTERDAFVDEFATPVAQIGDTKYFTLGEACEVAAKTAGKVTVEMLANSSETINLAANTTLDPGDYTYSGTLMGAGTYILAYTGTTHPSAPSGVATKVWTGTVWIKGDGTNGNINNLNADNYAHTGSKLAFTGCDGYFSCFSDGEVAAKEVKLVDEGSLKALSISNGSSSKGFLIKKLTGSGTLTNRNSDPSGRGISIADMSAFEGTIDAGNRAAIRLGTTTKSSGTAGTITVEGTIGACTLSGAVTFENGVTIDLTNGPVTISAGKTVTFGNTLTVTGTNLNEGDTVVSVANFTGNLPVLSDDFSLMYSEGAIKLAGPIATVTYNGEELKFTTIANALEASIRTGAPACLTRDTTEAITIPENAVLDTNGHNFSGTLNGAGKIVYRGTSPSYAMPSTPTLGNSWTGTCSFTDYTSQSDYANGGTGSVQFYPDNFANENSKIEFNGCKFYISGATYKAKEIIVTDNGTIPGLVIRNGWHDNLVTFKKLSGEGTIYTNWGSSQRYRFADVSAFTGTVTITTNDSNRPGIIFGDSSVPTENDAKGKIMILSGATATLLSGKTWSAPNGFELAGTLSGTGTIDANVSLKNGATIDVTGNTEGAALTLKDEKSVTFGGVLNLVGLAEDSEDTVILKNVSSVSDFDFATVKINGSIAGRLLYDEVEKTISYTASTDDSWTPDTTTAVDGIFTWSVGSSWKLGSQTKTWANDDTINVRIDAATLSGVVIDGQITAGNVVVLCSDEQDHDFEFHNPLKTVNGSIEIDEANKLTANSILMPQHRGNLGLKVPIVGEIGFSDNTHLVFRTGTGSNISEAYSYNVNTHGAAIIVDVTEGAGKFEVPSTMYAQKFEVKENATIVFNKTTDITGIYSGAGKLAKMGEGTTALVSVNLPSGGVEVLEGMLKLNRGSSNYPFWNGNTPLPVKVAGDATLDLNGCEGFKSAITLEAGATLASDDASRDLGWGNASLYSISLDGDATVRAVGDFGILCNGRGNTEFALNGYKLTKTGDGIFHLCNTTVASDSTGSIDVQAGRLAIWNKAVNIPNVDIAFADGTSLALTANLTAHDITITGAVTITSDSSGTLSGSSIKLTTATSTLTVPTKLADDAVTTDIEGKFVDFNETDKIYSVADKIAKIGDKNYSSVGAAIAAATADQTVEIIADSTETIALTKDVTISVADGQSFSLTKLTGSYNVTKVGAGTLTVNCGVPSGKTLNVNEGTLTLKCDGEAIVGTVNIAADATLDMSTSGYGDRINYRAGNSPIINVKGTWLLGENRQTINNTVTLNVYAGATISGAGDNNNTYACALDFLGTNTVHFDKNSDDEENAEATLATVITPRDGNNNSVTFSIPEGMTVDWAGAKRSDEQSANCNKKGNGKIIVSGGGALKISAPTTRPIVFGEAILDLSGFTTSSASVFAGGLTIGENTTIKFPEGFAEDAEFTLTNGSLTSEAGATVSDKVILVGATEKTVTLTFGEHTVAYSLTDPNDTWTYNKASGSWSDAGAWSDPTGVTHSWSDATTRTIAVFDASQTSAILVDGIYAPKMVQLIGTGDEFIFHNGTGEVDGSVELDSAQYCINAPVLTTGFTGNLGLRVAITGTISFGPTTKLIFSSGDVGDETTAYAYTIDGQVNPIGVSGSGKFIVPSSMYGIAFDVESKATAVYQEASATITGAITGTGTVELKNGQTLNLGSTSGVVLHYVSSGTTANTLKWTGNGSASFTSTDSKTKPVVKVETGSTFNIYGHDYSGWHGGLTDYGWFVNDGTLVFQRDGGDNSRFWREHIVLGDGAKIKIDTSGRHLLLYGGVGTEDACQIMLPAGEATIEQGVTNSGKNRCSIYLGNDGSGDYGDNNDAHKGAGISVGENATLTVSVPLAGGDKLTKYGEGTLVLSGGATSYSGTITLKAGTIKSSSQINSEKIVSADPYRPAVSETLEGEMYGYALSYGKIKVDACGYLDVAEAMKHLTTSSTIEIIDTTITKESLETAYGITLTPGEGNTFTVSVAEAQMEGADEVNLIFSEIMPKPSDKPSSITTEAGYDENGLESGWVELENTSTTKWVDLANYKFLRVNRSKATSKGDYGAFPSVLIPPHSKFVFYTSERYSNSADMTVSAWVTPAFTKKDKPDPRPKLYGPELHNMLVWPDKINPKKFPFVRLMKGSTIIDTVVIPSDIPEGHSIIVTPITEENATVRYMTNKPTKGTANTALDDASIVKLGPNVGPLYEIAGGEKHSSVSEFGAVKMATPGEDYVINFSLNPTMSPTEAADFRAKDAITGIKLVYRTWGGTVDAPTQTNQEKIDVTIPAEGNFDAADQGYQYSVTIPKKNLPEAGQLIQWKFEVTDAAGNEWTTPSFHNKDDGYEWYGTIVDPGETEGLTSASLPNWHMFVTSESKGQMDRDAPNQTIANNARVAIYDASTKCYYDYVRIDLRGNTSSRFGKKSHGLRFSKANPLMMTDIVTGKPIVSAVRKSSLISEFGDPSYVRQMTAFWLLNKVGSPAPFDFPVHCNLNGAFFQLAFHSERFTDELIEDFHGLDKFGYGYKNVGVFTTDGTTSGGIEKKTPDDGNEGDDSKLRELYPLIAESVPAAQRTANVVKLFDLPAWINYLAATRITQETDDVWGNISAYLDDAEMKEENAYRGTGTWMPLAYDMNQSFGQWHYGDLNGDRTGLMATEDWHKSHPFYGGDAVRCYESPTFTNPGRFRWNRAIDAVYQSEKFRRLYLRRLRTLMDQELGEPNDDATAKTDNSPIMVFIRQMADKMTADAAADREMWGGLGSSQDKANAINVWPEEKWNMTQEEGIKDLYENYIVPRRRHLFETHSINNTAKTVGYGTEYNAGIPNKQSDIATLKGNITIANLTELSSEQATELAIDAWFTNKKVLVIHNANNEAVDMSGWKLSYSVEFTLPAGTVVDANDDLYVVADRRAYIEELADSITDQVIVGNAKMTGAGPIMLTTAEGVEVVKIVPMTDARRYLRLNSFCGNTTGTKGDVEEWFVITNTSNSVTLDFKSAPVTICFLKDDKTVTEETDAGKHCHVTIDSGSLKPGKALRCEQASYADKGWSKIQNNKQIINIYDMYGVSGQTLKVTQKDYPFAYGHGAFLETTSTATTVKNSDWIQVWTEGDLTIGNFTADGIDGMAKDLIVRASAPMTIDLQNPTFGDKASLKIEGATSVVTIKGTATKTVAGPTVIKSKGSLVFEDGVYDLISTDDCIQADGDITINGGTFICHSTGNDGIDSNQNIVINGGTIFAFTAATEEDNAKSTGLDVNDGHSITINGGTVIATSLEAAALNKLTLAGSQAAKVVAVTGLTADEAKTIAIADILVPFPAMTTVPTAVLVSKPGMTSDSTVEVEEEAPGTVEIVAEDAEAGTDAVHATVPASWVADKEGDAKVAAAEAFVLGLAEPTEKPMVSSEQTTEADSIRIVDNVAPRFGTGVTVKRTLFVGTTPDNHETTGLKESEVEETNGGFTVPLPTEGLKVKYIKIKYSFK